MWDVSVGGSVIAGETSDVAARRELLQYEEVKAVKWASKDEIIKMVNNHAFIPYNVYLIELLFFMRNHAGTHTRIDTTSVKLR